MKPLIATALTVIATTASLAAALSAAEAKVRLAEVTLERSALLNGRARADLTIAPTAGKIMVASAVDRLRLALGVELRGAGKVRRVTLVLPHALGGTRQTLFVSKTGGPSVQVDFRLRTGEKLRKFVATSGLALCRSGSPATVPATVTVDIPVGLAIVARNGRRQTFRLRRTIPVVVACPVAPERAKVARKLGRNPSVGTARDGDAPDTKSRQAGGPRRVVRDPAPDPALDGIEQRVRPVTPDARRSTSQPPAIDRTQQAPAAES